MKTAPIILTCVVLCNALALHAREPVVALVAPSSAQQLEGGSESILVWSADHLPAHAEEWEAFLSVDGGQQYPMRITPHLDAGIQSFRWLVPNIATTRARILLRFGNETDERTIELPQYFSIVPRYAPFDAVAMRTIPTAEEGEAARIDDEPSSWWVSGGRDGSHPVTHHHHDPSVDDAPAVASGHHPSECADLSTAPDSFDSKRPVGSVHLLPLHRREAVWRPPPVALPLLLLSTRLNV